MHEGPPCRQASWSSLLLSRFGPRKPSLHARNPGGKAHHRMQTLTRLQWPLLPSPGPSLPHILIRDGWEALLKRSEPRSPGCQAARGPEGHGRASEELGTHMDNPQDPTEPSFSRNNQSRKGELKHMLS